jgi:hypothetical protein
LAAIKAYRLSYGGSAGPYQYTLSCNDANLTSFSVTNLPLGTYQVVVTAIHVSGLESAYSTEAVKVVQ